jgi:hypothetical protein
MSQRQGHGAPISERIEAIRLASRRDADVEFSELLLGYCGGGVGHEVDGFGGFGEGDDFAQAGCAGEQHDDAIEAESDAAVRGRSVFERVEEEAETLARIFFADAERGENLLLDIFAVDTDGAGAELEAVHGEVVAVGADGRGVADEVGHVGFVGRGEGMMRGHPVTGRDIVLEHGKVDDPDGVEGF